MKKILMIAAMFILLVGCEEKPVEDPEVVIDCDQGTVEINQLCEDFKTVNLLSHDIVYDSALYGDDLENIDWGFVFYQYQEYYDMIKPFIDEGVVTFDASDIDEVVDDVYEVVVTYNDSVNQELEKSLYVEYRDSRLILKEDGNPVNIAIGSFTYNDIDHDVTFDTHPGRQYVFHIDTEFMGEMFLNIYVTREDEFQYFEDNGYDIEIFDLGIRVFLWDEIDGVEVEKDVYYVFHNDILLDKNYAIEPTTQEEGITSFPVKGDVSYIVEDFYLDTINGNMHFTLNVFDENDTIYYEEVVIQEQDEWYQLFHPGLEYDVFFQRINEFRLMVWMESQTELYTIIYVIEP